MYLCSLQPDHMCYFTRLFDSAVGDTDIVAPILTDAELADQRGCYQPPTVSIRKQGKNENQTLHCPPLGRSVVFSFIVAQAFQI